MREIKYYKLQNKQLFYDSAWWRMVLRPKIYNWRPLGSIKLMSGAMSAVEFYKWRRHFKMINNLTIKVLSYISNQSTSNKNQSRTS
jgi:hypothetical protein